LNRFFDLLRLCGLSRAFALALHFFCSGLPGGGGFLRLTLQFFGGAALFLLAKTCFLDLAFALFDILAFAGFDQGARPRVHLASGKLTQDFLRSFVRRRFGRWALKGAMLCFLRRGLRLRFFGQ